MEMALLLPSVAISGAVSYGLYRYLLARHGLHGTPLSSKTGNEGASTISSDGFADDPENRRRYEVFGRDITELVDAAFSSPMNVEARKVYERHLERYGRSFRDGKKVIPFECLIALTHNLQPIVNERGEVLVACFKDDKIKSAPVIDEGTPAKTEFVAKKESVAKAEALETPSPGSSNGDFVEVVLGDEAKDAVSASKRRKSGTEENAGNSAGHAVAAGEAGPAKREKPKKEKPAHKARKAKSAKREEGEAPGAVEAEKTAPKEKTASKKETWPTKVDASEMCAGNERNAGLIDELDVFDVFSEEASDGVEAVAPVDDLGFATDKKESAADGDESTTAHEKPPAPPAPGGEATVAAAEMESLDMPAHIELDICEGGQKLAQAIVEAIGSSEEARRAVAHNLAFHRHVILLNRSHVLIEQQYLAQAVVETFRTCFERDAAAIRGFKKNFKAINEIALALTEDKMMRDEYWPNMKAYCVEIDAVNYRGYFLRVGDAFISKYLGDAVLRKMVLSPQIAAGAGEPDCPKSTPMLHKEIP